MNTMVLLAGGAAALYFMSRSGVAGASPLLGGAPAGYTPVGSGLYRDSAGALYARNPSTGQMVKAPTGTSPTDADDLLLRAGISLIPTVGTAVGQALPGLFEGAGNWLSGLFSGQESATTPNFASQDDALMSTDPLAMPLDTTLAGETYDPWAGQWWDQPVYYEEPPVDFSQDAWWDAPAPEPVAYEPSYDYAGFFGRRPFGRTRMGNIGRFYRDPYKLAA